LPPTNAADPPPASRELPQWIASNVVAQVWLVTHSERLAKAIADSGAGAVRTVVKQKGATTIEGLTLFGTFREEDVEEEE
jgi:predicted ATPase